MSENPLKRGQVNEDSKGLGTVTRETVQKRARELAIIHGRTADIPLEADMEQARRELTGQSDIDPQTETLESAPEAERWDLVPGSPGHKARVAGSEDEDDEGRSDRERLVEEGMGEAEHDTMLEAEKDPPPQK